MANMELIETKTVGSGGAATIEFTGLGSYSSTYTDLMIVVSGRTNRGTYTADTLTPIFNGSTANFTMRVLSGNGASASSDTSYINAFDTNVATASTFGNMSIYIPNYSSSNYKSISVDAVTETNGTTAYMSLAAGLWSQTSAITSFGVQPQFGTQFEQYSSASLYGISAVPSSPKATGGIVSQDASYWYHMFPFSSTFTPTQNITCDYLVIAGGGSGTSTIGFAGGGAGGLRSTVGTTGGGGSLESPLSLTANTNYTVTVGAGGAAPGASSNSQGSDGSNSVFSTITATGGGGGGTNTTVGSSGGSGGGGGTDSGSGSKAGGAGTTNQGYAGSSSFYGADGVRAGGAGGGAGAVGVNASSGVGGKGGAGVPISAFANATFTGVNTYYAGGGGGGTLIATPGAGGLGGGGNASPNATGANGVTNTGSGGGGGDYQSDGNNKAGGNGGSGLVIVRYAK